MLYVKVIFVENPPYGFSKKVIKKWKSNFFKISMGIGFFKPDASPDLLDNYGYSDEKLRQSLVDTQEDKENELYNLKFYVVNVPLAEDCFSRILSEDTIVITYYEIKDILESEGLPLENYLLSSLYTYVFLYKCYDKFSEENLVHLVCRGCIFDFCGNKKDVINSCDKPKICESCRKRLVEKRVPVGEINKANQELRHLRRNVIDRLKKNPTKYIVIFSIVLPLMVSVTASLIYDSLKNVVSQEKKQKKEKYMSNMENSDNKTYSSNNSLSIFEYPNDNAYHEGFAEKQ